MVSVKLTLQNCSEWKMILLVLSVNRRTMLMSLNYCANCTSCLYGIKYFTKLVLLRIRITRETTSNWLLIELTRLV